MLKPAYHLLDSLRLPHGLYLAAPNSEYHYVWIRDSVYMSLPFVDKSCGNFEKTIHRLFDLFLDYQWKIELHTKQKPLYIHEYIHARYTSSDVKEIHDQEWGHVQHDAIGAFLFAVGLGEKNGRNVFRNDEDKRMLQLLVHYLKNCEYWNDPDNGMWEEKRELHTSSIGACIAGLREVKHLVEVPDDLIQKGIDSFYRIFPNESPTKIVDLAQLSLIYPYNLLNEEESRELLKRVEKHLVRERGVIRYKGDSYYSTLEVEYGRDKDPLFYSGTELEWSFGFPWLSLCYRTIGENEKADFYLKKSEEIMLEDGKFPEGYFARTDKANPNTPLGWSSAMYILAKEMEVSVYQTV